MSEQTGISPVQRNALRSATVHGRVYGRQSTIAALMRRGLVEDPRYSYSSGPSWAIITELGRTVAGGQ